MQLIQPESLSLDVESIAHDDDRIYVMFGPAPFSLSLTKQEAEMLIMMIYSHLEKIGQESDATTSEDPITTGAPS